MKVFDTFKAILTSNKSSKKAPIAFCPNCWGRQQYEGKFYTAVKNEEITTKNIEAKRGWIEGYVEKNLTGIKLVTSGDGLVCNHCHTKYAPAT